MSYLSETEIADIQKNVRLLSIKEIGDVSQYPFNSSIEEYNDFLKTAKCFHDLNISKTFFLIHKVTNELLGYMTLAADSIKLTEEEKENHDINEVPYASVPALKIGKLAVNKFVGKAAKRKGYGSFLLDMARAFAFQMNELGVACRFITVDADIEYNEETPCFYKKNGFVENLSNKNRNAKHTISMRKDIFEEN